MLDISKAFNKPWSVFKLTNRNVPRVFLHLSFNWYSTCEAIVKWGHVLSRLISITAEVRQGGIISALLFAACINNIIESWKIPCMFVLLETWHGYYASD